VLKVRVIPTLLWKDVGLVKGVRFDSWRRVGPVLPAIKVYNARDVDELILLDITASLEGRGPDTSSVADFASACSVPFTVGGGIRSADQISSLLRSGADKIAMNTALYETPDIVDEAARRYGSQCVVASIDAKGTAGRYTCVARAGTVDTGRVPVDVAREAVDRGAGEILITSIDRDGTMTGYDIDLLQQLSTLPVPVIASGGAGSYADLVEAVRAGGASAVAAASMFHFTEQTPAGAKAALHEAGIPVRQQFDAAVAHP
jgi:imidazole glycerol-phosphate synthase subunit HisF